MLTTYILRCGEHARPIFYVGRTEDLFKRLRDHWDGCGSMWCKMHKPKSLHAVFRGDCENAMTLAYMWQYGWQFVRGGCWTARKMGKPKLLGLHKPQDMSATQQISDVKIENWRVQPPQKNKHGGQIYPVSLNADSKAHPRFQLGSDLCQLRIPFGPTSYGEVISSRQNLDFAIPPWLKEVEEFLMKLDDWILTHVWENINEFYPKRKFASKEELSSIYCPLYNKKSETFDPLLRSKINVDSVKVFEISETGSQKSDFKCILANSTGVPVLTLTKIWKMTDRFGATLMCDALMCWPRQEKTIDQIFVTSVSPM